MKTLAKRWQKSYYLSDQEEREAWGKRQEYYAKRVSQPYEGSDTCIDCTARREKRGYCAKHYAQHYRKGDFEIKRQNPKPKKTCSVEGCVAPHIAKGYCKLHYDQHNRGVLDLELCVTDSYEEHFRKLSIQRKTRQNTKRQRHGMSHTVIYNLWNNTRKDRLFPKEWKGSFNQFYIDMGDMPSANCSLNLTKRTWEAHTNNT